MDYESPDGSQFSLRGVRTEQNGESTFACTSVSAYVNGSAFVGRLPCPPAHMDETEILTCLEPIPPDCIHPKIPEELNIAPDLDPAKHYLKAPSYTYEDCQPGKTFVAECVLNEVSVLARLKVHPHPNLATYHSCVVKDGRITHTCLERYPLSLVARAEQGLDDYQRQRIVDGIQAGINYLHDLGLAHHDISPENICLHVNGEPIIVDSDGCLHLGERLLKGVSVASDSKDGLPISSKDNARIGGMNAIEDFLNAHAKSDSYNSERKDEHPIC